MPRLFSDMLPMTMRFCVPRKILPFVIFTLALSSLQAQAADPKSSALADEEGMKTSLPQPQISNKSDDQVPAAGTGKQASTPDTTVTAPQGTTQKNDEVKVVKQPARAPKTTVAASRPLPKKSDLVPSPTAYVPPKLPSVLDKNTIIAFYGNPKTTKMGILGEQSMEESATMLNKIMGDWDACNGERGVMGAFHIIYATVHADASVGILSDDTVKAYIDYASAHNLLVVLDHQIGKNSIETVMNELLPWLKYPCVHLAIDPEWKTLNPGVEIGTISAEDVNTAQKMMEQYMVKEGIKERRMLIVHQFNAKMITQRETVRSDFDHVDLVHHADGFGAPELKLETYNFVASVTNIPLKGFKLFYPKAWKKKGFDNPMMSPEDVMKLDPQPLYISYQ